jgi:RND family efflux transporter MFP subunit
MKERNLKQKIPKSLIWLLSALMLLSGTRVWAETVEYDGMIEPNVVVEIGAPAAGIVAKVTVDRSSLIKQGQILVELESSVERAALRKAQVTANFDGEISLQQTQLAFAKRVHERVKQLSAISTHDKDQAATEIELTKHRLEKARENRSLAAIELEKSQAQLALRTIKSPISGVVVDRYVSPGEYVNNQPLLRVAQIDPLRVEVIVPAQMFGRINPGMTATIVPELQEYAAQTATVTIADKVIDSASNTFGVRLELPNTEHLMPSGLKCLVQFELDAKLTQ